MSHLGDMALCRSRRKQHPNFVRNREYNEGDTTCFDGNVTWKSVGAYGIVSLVISNAGLGKRGVSYHCTLKDALRLWDHPLED